MDRCADVKKILRSCDIHGKDVVLLWRNLESSEADTQASVFVRQGHYARDRDVVAAYPPADVSIEHIGDLTHVSLPAWLASGDPGGPTEG